MKSNTDLCLFGIVSVGFPVFDQLDSVSIDGVEVVGRMAHYIAMNVKKSQVLQDCLLKFGLLSRLEGYRR